MPERKSSTNFNSFSLFSFGSLEDAPIFRFPVESFQYDKVKNSIFVVVQNAGMNQELLEKVPHELREDLALLYRVNMELPNGEKGSVLVHNNHLEMWRFFGKRRK